jgi:hypothetical protein
VEFGGASTYSYNAWRYTGECPVSQEGRGVGEEWGDVREEASVRTRRDTETVEGDGGDAAVHRLSLRTLHCSLRVEGEVGESASDPVGGGMSRAGVLLTLARRRCSSAS